MVSTVLCHVILFVISIFEIWLYYKMLFGILLDKQYMQKSEKVLMWGSIIVAGGALAINRKGLFFSHTVFLFILILMILGTWLLKRKCLMLIVGIVFVYCSFIALLDFGFAFWGLALLGNQFSNMIYFDGLRIEKILVYVCARIIMVLVVLIIKKGEIKYRIIEFRNTLLVFGIVCIVLVRYYQMSLVKMVFGAIPINWENSIFSLVLSIVIMSFICILLFKYKIIKQENSFILMKEKLEQQKYWELLTTMEKNKELIHNTKHHYLAISELERRREYEKLHNYVEELKCEFVKINPQIHTGNRIIDLVLSQKRIMAESKEIYFELQVMPISELFFKDSEICAIFGNLLDNAIEACEKIDGESRIFVKIEQQRSLLYIEISNTISEENAEIVLVKALETSKKDKDIHGYGMKSVQRIVDRYEGALNYKIKENKFIVRLTFFDINKEQKNEGR